jgi:thioredoxin reductase
METPDLQGAYPRLSDAQVAALTALGERRAAQPEEVLFREGQRNSDFFVVLAGNVAVIEARGTPEERTIAVHGRHRFLGELGLLTGEASYFTAAAVDAGEVLAVPVERLRELVARDPELADRAVIQARKFGARFAVPAEARSIRPDDGQYTVGLDDGISVTAASVVIATGARYRRLDVPRMEYFEQMSVYYAASQAEALLCRGDLVAIVGGGNSAGQAAVFLSRHAERVTLIVREHDLGECMSRYLIDQVSRLANVRVLLGTEVRELLGDQALEAVAVEDNRTAERRTLEARALFVFIGVTPCTGWLSGLVELDNHSFVRTGPDAARPADAVAGAETGWQRSVLETSRPGIFAVGDARCGSTKRVAAAVGEGAMAIRLAFERARAT